MQVIPNPFYLTFPSLLLPVISQHKHNSKPGQNRSNYKNPYDQFYILFIIPTRKQIVDIYTLTTKKPQLNTPDPIHSFGQTSSIGKNFQDSLKNLNASIYKIKVTSVTRTVADVKKLRKRNTNSSLNSAHQYGTTFDVSWVRYTKIDEKDTLNIDKDRLKMVLASVLRDLRRADRCYIKHERKQGCFHITAREL